MAAEGLKPLRIRNGLRLKFDIPSAQMPELSTVQTFVNNFARSKLGNHDRDAALTFTWKQDGNGEALVGEGTDSSPFVVGVTTRKLLCLLRREPTSFVFHIDATYKLTQVGYPVLVIGISDECRSFHLVAFIVVSQTYSSTGIVS
eukprot:jgi/Phyca11/103418/e_gw1.8.324.1